MIPWCVVVRRLRVMQELARRTGKVVRFNINEVKEWN